MKKLYVAIFATFFLICSSASAEQPTLVVAHTPDYQPLNFMRDGELVGIEADNARELAMLLGMKLERRVMPFAELLKALDAGEVDIVMAGVSVTNERRERLLFTDPFMRVGQMAIILADSAASFGHPRAMYRAGVRIGVEPNTTGHRFVENRLPDASLQFYADPDAAFQALREHKVDLYIHDAPTSWRLASDRDNQDMLGLFRALTEEQLAWAVRKDNTLLAARVNAALAQLQSTGTIRAIQNYWIPVTVQLR